MRITETIEKLSGSPESAYVPSAVASTMAVSPCTSTECVQP